MYYKCYLKNILKHIEILKVSIIFFRVKFEFLHISFGANNVKIRVMTLSYIKYRNAEVFFTEVHFYGLWFGK